MGEQRTSRHVPRTVDAGCVCRRCGGRAEPDERLPAECVPTDLWLKMNPRDDGGK